MRSKIEEMSFLYNKENQVEDNKVGQLSARRLTLEEILKNRKEAINTRMRDLLDDLQLNDRLVEGSYKIEEIIKDIDYSKSMKILQDKVMISKNYIDTVLKIKK